MDRANVVNVPVLCAASVRVNCSHGILGALVCSMHPCIAVADWSRLLLQLSLNAAARPVGSAQCAMPFASRRTAGLHSGLQLDMTAMVVSDSFHELVATETNCKCALDVAWLKLQSIATAGKL